MNNTSKILIELSGPTINIPDMQPLRTLILLACFAAVSAGHAAEAKILKVLPHFLDLKGRHSLSPSLFERDAYQAHLRTHPAEVSGLRFDVQWKANRTGKKKLRIKLELRGAKAGAKPVTVEQDIQFKGRLFTAWARVPLSKEAFNALGGVNAWRATLWDGEKRLSELKSFLW